MVGEISADEYNARVAEEIRSIIEAWDKRRQDGSFVEDEEYERGREKIGELINKQDSAGKMMSFGELIGKGVLPDDTFAAGVKLVVAYAYNRKDELSQKSKFDSTARSEFNKAIRAMSKLFDKMPVALRKQAFAQMDDQLATRVIDSLPAAQQLRIKRELIEAGRKLQ